MLTAIGVSWRAWCWKSNKIRFLRYWRGDNSLILRPLFIRYLFLGGVLSLLFSCACCSFWQGIITYP